MLVFFISAFLYYGTLRYFSTGTMTFIFETYRAQFSLCSVLSPSRTDGVMYINTYGSIAGYSDVDFSKWSPTPSASPLGAAIFFVSFVLIGTMIVLNLVIGVIMNSMDESNQEMAIQQEMNRRKENPDAIRDGLHDLHRKVEDLSEEMSVIKKMIENQSGKN